ncbi:MAG: hypothetical protein L6R35_003982 [Caloplaca aegaea]|nr:MAG: hypothetical protein L6R35_003982 [Caloplaca aegaea]
MVQQDCNLTLGSQDRRKRHFGGDSWNRRSGKPQTHEIPLDTSFVLDDSNVRDDGDGEDGYVTEGTISDYHAVKNIHPPHPTRAGTLDPGSTAREDPLGQNELNRALLQISPKATIAEAKVRMNSELIFVVGFGSPVWASYIQIRYNHHVQTFMEALKCQE